MQGGGSGSRRAGRTTARRPTRGMEVKDDTYATLKVIKSDGTSIPLVDSGSAGGANTEGYTNFLLQSVSESRMEKHQIIETFGASYVFFFGESPRFLDVSAQLLNSHDFNWEAEWWANYNMYLRGTKLVEMGARCYLSYDDNVVEGYLMQAQAVKASDQHLLAQLQFRFFVTNCYNVSRLGDTQFPMRASVQLPANINLQRGDAGRQLVSNLQGSPFGQALANSLNNEGQRTADMIAANITGASRSLSQLVRSMPPSFAVSADWWSVIESRADIQNLVVRAGQPIRGSILDNDDEYVGTPGNGYGTANYVGMQAAAQDPTRLVAYNPSPSLPGPIDNPARTLQESNDLFWQATAFLSCYGADINNPAAYAALGIQANFSAGVGVGASFGPVVDSSFGFTAGSGVGLGAVAGGVSGAGSVSAGAGSSSFSSYNESTEFEMDTLSVVYGRRSTRDIRFSSSRQKLVEVGFDFTYGYESDYTKGPGFGKSGFGDYGGQGFGSGNSSGDPGYRSPDEFTFAGVADEASAFERFTRRRQDRTALTGGTQVGRGELGGGASAEVSGRVSAFALASVEGTLDVTGNARTTASYSSSAQVSASLGLGLGTPAGVNCPSPGGTGFQASISAGVSVSVGASVSAALG
jgi:hypothetical protein